MNYHNRAGYFMKGNGYEYFVPAKLPPDPPIQFDVEMQSLLSTADRKLGRLDGITQTLPNPNMFVAMYVVKEAVLSSQIEGTQASLADVINAENRQVDNEKVNDIAETINYVNAMNWGLSELPKFPLSLRLIRNIHEKLLKDTRGSHRNPGEFRTSQNWIGPQGCTLKNATFVPPAVPEMNNALADLELYMHKDDPIPPLVKIAIIHAQFETIHPFLDGNGRMGRLLITFWLCQQEILTSPLLYLSYYFKLHRAEYYDRLMDVRKKGFWEEWIKFFLRGVAETADESTTTAKEILLLQKQYSEILNNTDGNNSHYQKLLNKLFETPQIQRTNVVEWLGVTNPTAGNILETFCRLGILTDMTPEKSRNKKYLFSEYIKILNRGTELIQNNDQQNTQHDGQDNVK